MRTSVVRTIVGVATAAVMTVMVGCGNGTTETPATADSSGGADAKVQVVASTNVWGNIAAAVGGDRVEVTSIISNPDADPHSYEANAGTALKLAKAVVVAAAAFRVTASPARAVALSVVFATVSVVGGILLALGGSIPISPYVTTIAFGFYLACRAVEAFSRRRGGRPRMPAGSVPAKS